LDPRRVVVAPFENRTGDSALAPLGRIAADWITRGLIESRTVEVVDPPATEAGSRSDPRAVGREAAAGTVVVGAYFSHGDSVGFEARVVSARDGRVVRAVEAALAPRAEALRAASILRERVVGALAAEFDRVLTGLARESSQPPTYEAYRAWVEGLDLYARREFLRSVPLFLQAAALDSSFVVPLVWAAAAYGNVGDYAHCDSLSRVADTERNRLTAHDRGLLDLWMANLRGDRLGRYDAARAMLAAAPASELALFIAGAAAIGVNRPAEAIRYLRRIPVDRSAVTWDLYGTRLGFALHQAGRYDEELVEARRRRQRQPVWIRAMEDEARALVALGRLREADRVMAEVATAQDQSGRRAGDAMYATALEMKWHGHSREANVLFGRAAEWARTRAVTDGGLTVTQYLLARSLYASGNLAAADSLFGVLAAQQSHSVAYLIGLGLTAAGRGDRARALRLSETLATLDQPYLFGANTVGRARIAALLGQRDEAVGLLRQAMSEGAHIEDVHLWTELQPLRGFPPFDALVAPTG
jgi:tetratricopeptide (TPR) repeat protein